MSFLVCVPSLNLVLEVTYILLWEPCGNCFWVLWLFQKVSIKYGFYYPIWGMNSFRPPIILQYSRRGRKGSTRVMGSIATKAGSHS